MLTLKSFVRMIPGCSGFASNEGGSTALYVELDTSGYGNYKALLCQKKKLLRQ